MNWLPEEEFKCLSDNFFDDLINQIDFPLEDIDNTNGEGGDWDAKFRDLEPPPMDMFMTLPSCGISSKVGHVGAVPVLKQSGDSEAFSVVNNTLHQSSSSHPDVKVSKLFQSSSPVSVLESSDASFSPHNSQRLTFPVKGLRSKRRRPTTLRLRYLYPFGPEKLTPGLSESETYYSSEQHAKKKRKISPTSHTVSSNSEVLNFDWTVRKCTHCETTKTPQWREGPNGPKTLCNACGVRFRSGRLVPEYRPASSPTFIPSVHSNSHRKIIEMRSREDDQFDTNMVHAVI